MIKHITKLTVMIAFCVALTTITVSYVSAVIPPLLTYHILYFLLAKELITRYERSKETKDKETKDSD